MQPQTARPRRARLTAWQLAALEKLVELELQQPRADIHRPGLEATLRELQQATGPMPPDFLAR